jgi:hypothetical protein
VTGLVNALAGTLLAGALLLPAAPAAAGPIAGVSTCPKGQVGVVVWHGDYNTGGPVDLVRVCVPLEP